MPSKFPESGVVLVADTSQFESGVQRAIKQAAELDALKPTVKVGVSDGDVDATARKVAGLETTATTKVKTDDKEVDDTVSKIDGLRNATIAIGVTVAGAGTVLSVAGLTGVIDYDNALASIEGRTGRMIPQARELIHDLYTSGWGESRDEIAKVIIEASNLGIAQDDLAEASRRAFEVSGVTGEETNLVLRAMNSLVKNDLVQSYTDAANVIVTGFQTGNDRGQDLLDTFNEYGSTFGQLRISGEGALSLINTGLKAGVDNSDRIADSIRETGIRLAEIGTNEGIAEAFAQLDSLSDIDLSASLDAFNAGEISGDKFFEGFFTALSDANKADPVQAKVIAATLVGTIAEDFGVEAISQLSPVWDGTMGSLEGRAETAGAAISNTLGASISTFFREVEEAAVSFLESDTLNLDEKIDALKLGLQQGLADLQAGGTLSEALTIALKPIGFDDEFQGLESMLGNFVIALLQVVASIQSLSPENWEAKKGTDAAIARLGEQQLAFDLQIGNADEIAGEISTALARGVGAGDISTVLADTIGGLIESGATGQAQAILDAVQAQAANYELAPDMTGLEITIGDVAIREGGAKLQEAIDQGIVINTAPALSDEAVAGLQANIDEAIEATSGDIESLIENDFGLNLELASDKAITLGEDLAATSEDVDTLNQSTERQGTTSSVTADAIDDVTESTGKAGSAARAMAAGTTQVGTSLTSISGASGPAATGLNGVTAALNNVIAAVRNATAAANAAANTPATPSNAKAGGGNFSGTAIVGEQGPEIITSDRQLGVLNNRTTEQIIAALQGYIPGGSFSGRGGNSVSVVNNNIVQSEAQADALGYSVASQIRGMVAT